MQLSSVDLDLVPVLAALLEEQNVARAARRLGLSPSATSHALARARDTLGDPLLVRSGRGLVRTPRAEAMLPALERAVRELETVFRPPEAIDPATLRRAFRLLAADDVHLVLLRWLEPVLRAEAPGVDLYGLQLGPGVHDRLRAGEADVAVGVFGEPPDDLARRSLHADRLVAVARAGHPAAARPLSIEAFAALTHLLVAPTGTPRGLVDDLLARYGLSRRVARTLPSFLEAAVLAAETDHVVTLPARVVEAVGARLGLRELPLSLELPRFRHSLLWHRRWDADPAHAWLRRRIQAVCAAPATEASAGCPPS